MSKRLNAARLSIGSDAQNVKSRVSVLFTRPIDTLYPVQTHYGEKGLRYQWSIDEDNGLWIPAKDRTGLGANNGPTFSCPFGTIVRAMSDGFIVRARLESALDTRVGAGLHIVQLVSLLGYDSWTLRYAHLSAVFVYPGQQVKQGQSIALSGNSGDTLECILHVDLQDLKYQWRDIAFA